ncbi:uncharacterized protein HMPREF1541_07761 [Cyphellophora europaea CBS 101466]|uniref:Uncharacterized protein n=1 Tax=Cyphellophora europaea (strain CBS 101466) TaxID=1220924 RepID=W2RNT6_CYPE1|nr:uncharacterized protein HMPREF1541_07761 [Cyphellophora europaea CBS 101466]ETN38137.1 hypothetical protein HMPREF1541_07761 [Cyphellophora europaea CBS 101466]
MPNRNRQPPQPPPQLPQPLIFVACGHQVPPDCAPSGGISRKKGTSTILEPAMCLECGITHTKNRQQLIVDSYQSKVDAKVNEIIERAMGVQDEKDQKEIIETGKTHAVGDVLLQRNSEVVSIWADFIKGWNFSERQRTVEVRADPRNPRSGMIRKVVIDYVTILVSRTASELIVTKTWKCKDDQQVMEATELTRL